MAEFRALGLGNLGSGDTSMLEYGNTPTGTYSGRLEETTALPQASYGPWGRVRLRAVSADAVLAEDVFGRRGLLVHGGSPGLVASRFNLKSTRGCIRLSNGDMRTLRGIIDDSRHGHRGFEEREAMCSEPEITVTVKEF